MRRRRKTVGEGRERDAVFGVGQLATVPHPALHYAACRRTLHYAACRHMVDPNDQTRRRTQTIIRNPATALLLLLLLFLLLLLLLLLLCSFVWIDCRESRTRVLQQLASSG
jgi:hypothetical protein